MISINYKKLGKKRRKVKGRLEEMNEGREGRRRKREGGREG